jgi:hypothetical protein
MASWREIERIRKDGRGFRELAKHLLTRTAPDVLTEWEAAFLAQICETVNVVEYTNRQSEKLLQIRDDIELLDKIGAGFSVSKLIDGCYLGRLDLTEDQEAWIVALKQSAATAIRRRDAGKLLRFAAQLGIIEVVVSA